MQQINDLTRSESLTICLDKCIGDFICEKNCLRLIEVTKYYGDCDASNLEQTYSAPNHQDILTLMTNDIDSNECKHSNYQWTEWNSATSSDQDDFETLLDHRRLYGFNYFPFLFFIIFQGLRYSNSRRWEAERFKNLLAWK